MRVAIGLLLATAAFAGEAEEVRRFLDAYRYEPGDFAPAPDRWRIPMPRWDRAAAGSARILQYDAPYVARSLLNPFRQNPLKGDIPLLGQNTFLVFGAVSDTVVEARDLPTPSAVSPDDPRSDPFFGRGEQLFFLQNVALSFELFRGNTAFKPPDFVLRVTPVVSFNYLDLEEIGGVSIDFREGRTRADNHLALQEAFLEKHLVDLSSNYDFLSMTLGVQPFVADFRGLLFTDSNFGARLTANLDDNRWQANLAVFYPLEKDTNSELNKMAWREQVIVVANLFRQDFLALGYTVQAALLFSHDAASTHADDNGVPVRPPILGDADPHRIDVFYAGLSGDGHLGRINLTHECFLAFGSDTRNPLAGREVDIFAQLLFVEASIDIDWWRPRVSFLWASGDSDPMDGTARGFDAILDNPNVAGGASSFWIRQGIRLLGVGLVQRLSLYPTLRSSKLEGQANFVNPGLLLFNAGIDADLSQEVRASVNLTHYRFSAPEALEPFLNQPGIGSGIGTELTLSAVFRPLLTNNVQIAGGVSLFLPADGFRDIYESDRPLYSAFLQVTLVY